MLQRKQLKKPREMIQIMVPKSRLRRPFPLLWGLMSLGLFVAFAVITLMQFSQINADKIYQARMDTYQSDEQAYNLAIRAYLDCESGVKARETYRGIFDGISTMFETSANLPVELFPMSEEAKIYQETLLASVDTLIQVPLAESLAPRDVKDCPQIPASRPVKPEK